MNSILSKVLYSLITFIIIELIFSVAFIIRYLFYKSLFSKSTKVLFLIGSIIFLIISIYLNF